MRISVINLTNGLLSDFEVITAIRAVNRQIKEDFEPYWNIGGTLRLEGASTNEPDADNPLDLQGEAIMYIWDKSDIPNALGYHEANYRGIPYGFVFMDIATDIGENWTVTFSHEVLELIGDRQANSLIRGPHPNDRRRKVYHWHEMCDAVQDESYKIDGVAVSNFVLPLYFTESEELGSRNDFLGTKYTSPKDNTQNSLRSFGINPGGYIGFLDPENNKHTTVMGPESIEKAASGISKLEQAKYRKKRKNKARMARRGNRYVDMDAAIDVQPETVIAGDKYEVPVKGHKISVRCDTHNLDVVSEMPTLENDKRRGMGYFAHDIESDGNGVVKDLKFSEFEEIGALELTPVEQQGEAAKTQVELTIDNADDELVLAMVEVNGVIFWKQPDTQASGVSVFNVQLQAVPKGGNARRGSLLSAVKTVVRFVKHKIVDKVKDFINNNLTKYLTDFIEKEAFGKKDSPKLVQVQLLGSPNNKTIGEIPKDKPSVKLKSGEKYLLLVHGIFSSIKGAFSELTLNRWDDNLLFHLDRNYAKIVGFEHWTVAKSTLENAKELLDLLPDDCDIDIVCHSRGAGVVRCLLEHGEVEPKLVQRKIKVGKVIFVAGACQGSPLAKPEKIGQLVNVFSALSSVGNTFFPLKLATGLFKAVQYGVKHFPGIASMSPDSPIFKELNKPLNMPNCEYIYARANYEPQGSLAKMFDEIGLDTFIFNKQKNDGVVPFDGAGTFDDNVKKNVSEQKSVNYDENNRPHVFHTAFFEQKEVRKLLIDELGAQPGTGGPAERKKARKAAKPVDELEPTE